MSGCGNLGYASKDGELRLYKQSECAALQGIWRMSGKCDRPEGGSFSVDCRGLNSKDPYDVVYRESHGYPDKKGRGGNSIWDTPFFVWLSRLLGW